MGDYEALFAVLMGFFAVFGIIILAICIISIIGTWKILVKGGKPGWGALIPFYNQYLLCDMVGVNPWWILIVVLSPILTIIPVIGSLAEAAISIYFMVLLSFSLARAFGKEDGFAIGLLFLSPIFYMILGCSKDEYKGKNPMKDIIFDNINQNNNNNNNNSTTTDATVTNEVSYCPNCGSKLEENSAFCPNCGSQINK